MIRFFIPGVPSTLLFVETLNIIGYGKLDQSFAHLWHEARIFEKSTTTALTEPIAREDVTAIEDQYISLNMHSDKLAAIYTSLGKIALDLNHQKGTANHENLDAIEEILIRNS